MEPFLWMKSNQEPCSTKSIKAAGKWGKAHGPTSPPLPAAPGLHTEIPSHNSLKTPGSGDFDARKEGCEGCGGQGCPSGQVLGGHFLNFALLAPDNHPQLQVPVGRSPAVCKLLTPFPPTPNFHGNSDFRSLCASLEAHRDVFLIVLWIVCLPPLTLWVPWRQNLRFTCLLSSQYSAWHIITCPVNGTRNKKCSIYRKTL